MPGRSYSIGSEYRYGFNGQENSDEIEKGLTTALYWEYDSRIGRRWNLDPIVKVGESLFSCFSNNPILRSDPNGDTDSTKNSTSLGGPGPKIPKWTIRIGETGGPWGTNQSTSIISLYGNKTYYNSSPNGTSITGQNEFKIDEPNSFIQIQKRIGGEKSNLQVGLNWFKQKFRNEDGYGYEAPTAFQVTIGVSKNLTSIGKKINVSSNFSVGAGPELGKPRFDDPLVTIPQKAFNPLGYSIVGVGASAIYRVDAIYSKHWVLFVAGTVHHIQTFKQQSSVGTKPGETIGSVAVSAGVGYNFGK